MTRARLAPFVLALVAVLAVLLLSLTGVAGRPLLCPPVDIDLPVVDVAGGCR